MQLDPQMRRKLRKAARNEITEHLIYSFAARRTKDAHNRDVLLKIAAQEKGHYELWRGLLQENIAPSMWKVRLYSLFTSVLGLSFSLRLMEKGESLAEDVYRDLSNVLPDAAAVMRDEQQHEEELLGLIDEGFLQYVSSFVLGLNDALVELTGALAGFTLALQDTKLIASVGLITGIAASLSMASAEYLSTKEEHGKNALRAGVMTGISYVITVFFLILPFFLLENAITALLTTLSVAILIIFLFTFYTSVAKRLDFKRRFAEMAAISLGVATLNFFIGFFVKRFFGFD